MYLHCALLCCSWIVKYLKERGMQKSISIDAYEDWLNHYLSIYRIIYTVYGPFVIAILMQGQFSTSIAQNEHIYKLYIFHNCTCSSKDLTSVSICIIYVIKYFCMLLNISYNCILLWLNLTINIFLCYLYQYLFGTFVVNI